MGKIYYVDLPNPWVNPDGDSYIHVATFKTLASAYRLLRKKWGLATPIAKFFISEGEE